MTGTGPATLAVATGLLLHAAVCAAARVGARRLLRGLTGVAVAAALIGPLVLLPSSALGRMVGVIALTYTALEALVLAGPQRDVLATLPRRSALVFAVAWPGVVPSTLRPGTKADTGVGALAPWLLGGVRNLALGIAMATGILVVAPDLRPPSAALALILAVLLAVHLGASDILAVVVRVVTTAGERPFPAPLASTSLAEFWGRRWNRPFSELARVLVVPPLRRAGPGAGVLGAFVVSAALHELAISYPAGAGFGLPTAYFLGHGALVVLEPRLGIRSWPTPLRRVWTLGLVALPLPLLFHQPFREAVVAAPLREVAAHLPQVHELPLADLFAAALLGAGLAHGLVLVAAVQVPARLRWREDLAPLAPFNRKLFWVYGGFIAGTTAAFGLLTLALRDDMVRGEPAALGLALLIGVWWAARVLVDAVVFDHRDWPPGWSLVLGHIALTALFVALSATYLAVVAWHVVAFG